MNSQEYQEFTQKLQQHLADDERVLGLVALGSMAQQDYQPDKWSDHDFFVITTSGVQETFRTNLGWLPAAETIAFWFRETQHGLKIIYKNGHLLEFAVFDIAELSAAKVNRYRILFERPATQLSERLAQIKSDSATPILEASAQAQRDFNEFGEFISNLLVGVGRYRRGEELSGHIFVKSYALRHLLVLLVTYTSAPNQALLDNLDPFRRFEKVYPEVGQQINLALAQPVPQAALEMLNLAEQHLKEKWSDFPTLGLEVVRKQIID